MPELPEVETVVRGLRARIVGWEFSRAVIRRPKCLRGGRKEFCAGVAGRTILGLSRRGKNILFHLSGGAVMVVHLRMTGQLRLVASRPSPGGHTHAFFSFRGRPLRLCFNDTRKFGRIGLEQTDDRGEVPSLTRLGPEPLEISARDFARRALTKRRRIKPLLLDQSFLAGVGNIYADESLHRAGIHPRRIAADLSAEELKDLYYALRRILKRAIRAGGTSVRSYVDPDGARGGYQDLLRVYRREGEPCRNCRAPLVRETVGGRSTFFCPRCQPESPGRR